MTVSVKQGNGGIWECRLYLGRDLSGKPIRPYKRFPSAANKEQAQQLAETWAASLTANGSVRSARLIDLLGVYISQKEKNGASPNSIKTYRLFLRYIKKYFPQKTVFELKIIDFNQFEQLLLTDKKHGGAGLSRNSVINIHQFLRGAYNHFVDAGIVEQNPMIYVSKPSPEHFEASAIDVWDFEIFSKKIMDAMDGVMGSIPDYRRSVYAFAAWMALVTGMRVGEVCAVRRADVKVQQRYIHVGGNVIEEQGRAPYRRNVTKGRKCRNISITESDLNQIRHFLSMQEAAIGHLPANGPLITINGSYMRPTTVSRSFSNLRRSCNLPPSVTFHSLRHTHASWLIANGCDLKTLSERMGHADESTTLRIYGHLMPGRDAAAAELFEDAQRRASGKGR